MAAPVCTAASLLKAELRGADPSAREPFKYFDKGSMATVSRYSAVVQVGRIEFGGFIGWQADIWLGTTPFGLVVFLVLGTVAGFWNVYKLAATPTSR
jgi:NADH dehydrogenase